jgi:hypothetical protein
MMMDDPKSKSEYYYGCSYKVWENLPYFEAIKVRRDKAKELYKKLSTKVQENYDNYDLKLRCYKAYKAWQDNDKLLNEKDSK